MKMVAAVVSMAIVADKRVVAKENCSLLAQVVAMAIGLCDVAVRVCVLICNVWC
jgi:hypothetical protein